MKRQEAQKLYDFFNNPDSKKIEWNKLLNLLKMNPLEEI